MKSFTNAPTIKHWFIEQMKELVVLEEKIRTYKEMELPDPLLIEAKRDGFADRYLAQLLACDEAKIREQRLALGMQEAWEPVPVSGVEDAAYYYSTYNAPDKVEATQGQKVMVLGGGPNRIGQGIEFDYCCVHAAFALRDSGYESIMVNCNPETVSTDYDTSTRLYFEPLTVEDVLSIYEKEKPLGIICQFGGQTPLNIANELAAEGVNILGHVSRCNRSGGRQGALQRSYAKAWNSTTGIGDGCYAGGSVGNCWTARLSAHRSPFLCIGWTRHGGGL